MVMTLWDMGVLLLMHLPVISVLVFYWNRCKKDLRKRREAKS